MISPSPLRYPGGKTKLYPYLVHILDANPMENITYVEPFAGGCGLALTLLQENKVKHIIINDYDFTIYAFWYSVLNLTDDLCNLIQNTPITINQWDIQKEIYVNHRQYNILDVGFATFFLNRTNRSGIINGGIIGGRQQQGNYLIDCRFNKDTLIRKIKKISTFKDKISLYNFDAIDLINNIIMQLPVENTFIYLDPPYVKKGPQLYINHYKFGDHEYLYNHISGNLKHRWFITYDFTNEISYLYRNYQQNIIDITYSAGTKRIGNELAIFSHNLNMPTT